MRLTGRLVAYLIVALVAVLGVDGYLSVQRQVALFDADREDYALRLGGTMRPIIADTWRTQGEERAHQMIRSADAADRRVRIRWVWLDGAPRGAAPALPRAALGPSAPRQDFSLKGKDREGHEMRYTYVPVPTGKDRRGALEISESLAREAHYASATTRRVLVLTVVLVLVGGGFAMMVGLRLIGRPLRLLIGKTRRIGRGDLSGPLRLRGRDELRELADSMNLMCERLAEAHENVQVEANARIKALEQLRHADRLTTVGRLAAGMAHELGTPLNVVSGRAGLIVSDPSSEESARQSAEIIRAQAKRMTVIIRKLLDFARRDSPQRARIDVFQLAQQTVELVKPLTSSTDAEITLEAAGAPMLVDADAGQIQQVLMNLLVNAVQAGGRRVVVRIGRVKARSPAKPDGPDLAALRIEVEDDGGGIPEAMRDRVFDPFFTTKDVGEGTGLGLSIAHGIMADHGGWIRVSSEVGKGSRFVLYLPQEVDA